MQRRQHQRKAERVKKKLFPSSQNLIDRNQKAEQDVNNIKYPKRSSEYTNRIQLIIKDFYYPFKAKQNSKTTNKFCKVFQEALNKYEIDSTVMERYLVSDQFKIKKKKLIKTFRS